MKVYIVKTQFKESKLNLVSLIVFFQNLENWFII